jgi:hypothetical protein
MKAGGVTFDIIAEAQPVPGGSYYTGKSEKAIITVAVPGTDNISGGGHQVLTQSTGRHAGTLNSKMNLGFTMKWNKSGKNIMGQANFIWRSGGSIYQIKSNAINTLGTFTLTNGRRADFNTKANLTDVTDPLTPISITGNLDLSVQAFESTDGGKDMISVILRSGNEVWFSSGPSMAPLSGGNIRVRSTATISTTTASLNQADPTETLNALTSFEAYPNPMTSKATIKFSLQENTNASLRVFDMAGREVANLFEGEVKEGAEYEIEFAPQNLRLVFI